MDKDQLYINEELASDSIYDEIHQYINSRYRIVFNEISLKYYIKLLGSNQWHDLNDRSLLIELIRARYKIKKGELETYLGSNYIEQINPFEEYFNHLEKWDKTDYITKLASYLQTDNDKLFVYHLKKWLVRTVKCAINKTFYNKNCIVLIHEEENSGKSTFCRFLTPPELKNYSAENISSDKDGLNLLCKNMIINLDEIDQISYKDIKGYKSMLSKEQINIRLPYAKNNIMLPRTCSFISSTNLINFLNKSSGDVRWICFELTKGIDFNYSKEIDINKIWAQALFLANDSSNFNPNLTKEDVIENKRRNQKYKAFTLEEDLINQMFVKSNDREDFMTSSQVAQIIKKEYQYANAISIGKELTKLNFKRINSPKTGNKGYLIKPRK